MHEQEQRAGPERIERVQALVASQQEREAALQERYKALRVERDDLLRGAAGGGAAVVAAR